MYLSKIKLVGFKSFAHKTEVDFYGGITSIVGPNGCGKTNIVDAIRWVLGEQKTSVLRSDKMESIIFNGSLNKKRLGFAEVSLIIENTKNILPSEYSQVEISRRYYRNGDSEYLLNKNKVRLKDITGLLMDSGMGHDAYSVIELSMIEQILDNRDEYRRRLFEEAAGITRYKNKRNESLRKLDTTRQDLIRVRDIIVEVERNVKSLKSQVNRAVRYKKMLDEVKEMEHLYYNAQRQILNREMEPQREIIDRLNDQLAHLSGNVSKNDAAMEKAGQQIIGKQEELKKAQEAYNNISHQFRASENSFVTLKERNDSSARNVQSLQLDIKQAQEKKERLVEQVVSLEHQKTERIKESSKAEAALGEKRKTRDSFLTKYTEQKNVYLGKSQQVFDVMNQLSEKIRQRDIINRERVEKNRRLEQLLQIKAQSDSRLKELLHNSKALSKKENALTSSYIKIREQKETALTSLDANSISRQKATDGITQARVSLESLRTKRSFLSTLVEENGDVPVGVGEILTMKEALPGVIGTVAELINVPKELRRTVESALGEQAHYIVVEKWENINKAIEFLRSKKLGRVTFIALDKIPDFTKTTIEPPKHPALKIKKRLSEYISADKKLQILVNALFYDIFVVENESLADLSDGLKFSTPCRIANSSGEISTVGYLYSGGGVAEDSVSIIGRKEHIQELGDELEMLEKDLKLKEDKQKQLEEEKIATLSSVREFEGSIDSAKTDIQKVSQELGIVKFEISKTEESLIKHTEEENQISLFTEKSADIDALNYDIEVLEKVKTKLQKEREKFQSEEERLEQERQKIDNEYTEINSQVSGFREIKVGVEKELKRLKHQVTDYVKVIVEKKNELTKTEESIEITAKRIGELGQDIEKYSEQQKDYEEVVLQLNGELNAIQEANKSELDSFRDMHKKLDDIKNEIQQNKDILSEKQQELRFIGDVLEQKNIESYDIDLKSLEYQPVEMKAMIQSSRIKLENFGPVNMEAVEEYEKERERFEFLQNQVNDLDEAEKSLIETITTINLAARERFAATFDRINENFQKIFSGFFTNGVAELKIDADIDPLEARIEIFAQPFGKKVQSISMFSGGEKALTALAILFAVYLEKPSPFCILDEVDAPLDDSNIARFIKMLQQFSDDTQFIVVTHNKKSMEAADTLYGVTMQESGISKLVSVKLDKSRNTLNN